MRITCLYSSLHGVISFINILGMKKHISWLTTLTNAVDWCELYCSDAQSTHPYHADAYS